MVDIAAVLVGTCALAAMGGTARASLIEETGSPIAVGAEPWWATAADFNGDGRPDLAVANDDSASPAGTVSVLLRQPLGGFVAEAPITVGQRPGSLASADFDGDGRRDLAVANYVSSTVTVLLRKPNGGFAPEGTPIVVGTSPHAVAAGDFNGDGRDDVATVSHALHSMTVLVRKPDNSGFQEDAGSPVAVGANPTQLAPADFNGDGRLDVAVADRGSDDVTVLLRDAGNDGFTAESGAPPAAGDAPVGIVTTDFDGDGRPDLAVAGETSDDVTVLLRQPTGGFTTAPGSPHPAGEGAYGLASADFNGDGRPDLAATAFGGNRVTVLHGTGTGDFNEASFSPLPTAKGPLVLAAADFDGNGRADLAIPNHDANTVTVRLGRADAPAPMPAATPAGCLPPSAGRIGLWRGEDDARDSIGGHDGSLENGGAHRGGVVGRAFSLPGADDYLHVPARPDLDITSDLSFDAWIQLDDTTFGATDPYGVGGDRVIGAKPNAEDTAVTFAFWIEGDSPRTAAAAPLAFAAGPRSDPTTVVTSNDLSWQAGTWYHVAVVRDGANVRFYRDGRPAGTAIIGGTPTATTGAAVGFGGSLSDATIFNPLKGGLDEAELWNKALTDAEVAELHATATGACATPRLPGPEPAAQPPVNTARPQITEIRLVPNTYRCQPGTWTGRDESRPYTFTWERIVKDPTVFGGQRYETVATGQTYRAATSDPVAANTPSRWLFRCVVVANNAAGSTRAESLSKTLSPAYERRPDLNPVINVRATGMEVTQAIQDRMPPPRDQAHLDEPVEMRYEGLTLARGHWTVVRVWADYTQQGGTGAPLKGVTARLEVYDAAGRRLSTLTPESSPVIPPAQTGAPVTVTVPERNNGKASFNFLIPWQQTHYPSLTLRATVNPLNGKPGAPNQCAGCEGNVFTLRDVPFVQTRDVPIRPVLLRADNQFSAQTEEQVFGTTRALMPGNVRIYPYPAVPLDVPADDKAAAIAAVAQWASDNRLPQSDLPSGVFVDGVGKLGGSTDVELAAGPGVGAEARTVSIVRDKRRYLTSVMHEIGHMLGLPHADTICGGNSNGQTGIADPPHDTQGKIRGFALDRRSWPSVAAFSDGYPEGTYYDFMSYCPPGDTRDQVHWIGVSNWNKLLKSGVPQAGADAPGPAVRVIAITDGVGGARLFSVGSAPSGPTPARESDYRVELSNAAGAVVGAAPAAAQAFKDGATGGLLTATVALPASATQLVIKRGADVVATRRRSAHPPTASITSPRAGAVARGRLLVSWRAADADGDALRTSIDYSADGGRTWRVVASDLTGRSVRLPVRALSASRSARLRVRVNDGFDTATAVSGAFRALGAAPQVQIITGDARHAVAADAVLLLEGRAFDDAGQPLSGRRLRWFAGRRLLGTGERLAAQGLPTSTRAIRLVATDAAGRSAQTQLRIRVTPVKPEFLVFEAPPAVDRRTRRLGLRVASTVPAELRIAGQRFRMSRSARRLTIPIRPGQSTLQQRYSLVAGRASATGALSIPRT